MATYSTPIPGVPQYGQAALAAKTAYQNTLARINQKRSSLLRSGGFAGDINSETGVVDNMRVDGSSKYGALQQLNRSQAMRDEAARWSGVERGLGAGGGLAAQLRNQTRFDFGREDSDLAQGLLEGLSGLQDEQTSAAYQRDAALYQAQLEAARMAIQNGDFNPADFSGLDYPGLGEDPIPASSTPANATTSPSSQPYRGHQASSPAALKAAQAALTAATKKGLSGPEKALAARSAALNAQHGLGGNTKYYTYRKDADKAKKPGQTVKFAANRGYYLD